MYGWLLIFFIILVFCYLFNINFKYLRTLFWVNWYTHKLPKPPTTNYLIGNVIHLNSPDKVFPTLREWALKYYPVYTIWVTPFLSSVNIVGPEDFELVLNNIKQIRKSDIYHLLHNWLGTGLLTSNDKKWFARRKILTPAFHFNILRQFVDVFNNDTNFLIDELNKECHKDYVEIDPIIAKYTLKTITETAMGAKLDFSNKAHEQYKYAIIEMGKIYLSRLLKPWLINNYINFFTLTRHMLEKPLLETLHTFTRHFIDARKTNFTKIEMTQPEHEADEVYAPKRRLAMLDLLLSTQQENGSIDDLGIYEEVDTFTFEGHDTTAVALSYILMLLACHKDAQNNILNEMEVVLGDIDRKPSFNQLHELKYLEQCIKECLRLYPSVHFISRKLGADLITSTGCKLLKGTTIFLHIYDLHHSPHVWPDPEKFDPDRFLPENCKTRHPFAFVPFSAGPRNCIGQRFAMLELKAAVCAILTNFKLEPVDTPESIVIVPHLVLKPKNNIRIKFTPRA